MAVVSMKQLLEAGVHFGHQTRRWNPKMATYIYTERNGIYIIDLQKTVKKLEEAYNFVRDLSAEGKSVLFVGTKKQAQESIREEATRAGAFYVNARWLGGMLTNFTTIRTRIQRLAQLRKMEEDGTFDLLPKKEVSKLQLEIEKLERFLGGIKDMKSYPGALFIVDPRKERIAAPTHLVHLPALRVVNTKFKKFDEERFERDMSVQVRSAVKLCKAFVPAMAKAKRGRVLFMLTSYLLGLPPKNTAAYIMAKSALHGLAKSLAADYAGTGVTVNCVMPSMMETKFLADTSNLIVEASAQANPMGRNARVEDVVPAMAFLLGEETGFITGVSLPITGGSAL